MNKLTLALICGGVSSEREVSLKSGDQVQEALDGDKYQVRRYDPKTDLARLVTDAPLIDAALIILHGPMGEDGTIQGLLELLKIPYQGSGVLGSALAMNKAAAKRMYESVGLAVPPYQVLERGEKLDTGRCLERLGLPLVVKPACSGSSIGMSIVRSEEMLEGAVATAFSHDHTLLLEAFISGIELTCGVIGNDELRALPLIEIVPDPHHDFFDYETKYTPGLAQEICPARIDAALAEKAQRQALLAHSALCCRGYSRTDMILRGTELFIIETNTIPGMTKTSLLPKSAQAAGIGFSELLDELIGLAIADHRKP
jgi:D-alanine-D-alanine ligase